MIAKVETSEPEQTIKDILRRHKELKARKLPWLDHWQLVGEFIHMRKQEFNQTHDRGEFLTRDIFDSAGPKAAKTSAASLVSMLWPSFVRRFRITPPKGLEETDETKAYYERVTDVITEVMDDPESGFITTLNEYMLDQIVFGTSGIEITSDEKTKVLYRPWGVKHMSIDEGKNGFVDTVYIEMMMTVLRQVKEYGIENVSPSVKEAFENGLYDDENLILIATEPRISRIAGNLGNKNMPWQSVHLEIKTKHKLKETGFTEMPIKVGRITKLDKERYGRSPGMDALPDIMESNAVWEATTVAIEKNLDPPLAVLDDGTLGSGQIDTSAGAINVFNVSGRASDKSPIIPLFTVGEINQSVRLIEQLNQSITDHFFIDRLLDFNNETQMTLGEAKIRDRLRNNTLGSVFSREIVEVISPTVRRTFNILFDQGELGVPKGSVEAIIQEEFEGEAPFFIPESIVKLMVEGKEVFKIEYFTPALRIMQSEEADSILRTLEAVGLMADLGLTEALDNIDVDETIRRLGKILGSPTEMFKSEKKVKEFRENKADLAEQRLQTEALVAGAKAVKDVGQSGMIPTQQKQVA